MTIRIVRAETGDWQRYREIRLRALAESPEAYASSLEREQAYDADRWQQLLTGAATFLAIEDRQVVGTATGWRQDPEELRVVAMYVVPEARGRRVAHALLDEIRRQAHEQAAGRLVLDVAEGNAGALASYRAYGFAPTGVTRPMERDESIVEIELALPLGR